MSNFGNSIFEIMKILEVDYPRGRAMEYYASRIIGIISSKSLKPEFSLFHPSISHKG
jgi:hypothetical protein